MLSSIKGLFEDLDLFARLIAKADLSKLTFLHFELSRNHMMIDIIMASKNQFIDVREAFAAIFCKDLHNMHEWDVNNQDSYDDRQWIVALKEIWIPENFLKNSGLQLEIENHLGFIKSVEFDLESVQASLQTSSSVLEKLTKNLKVIRLQKGSVFDKYFGESEDYYFLYEWGIYS